jgi:hypothetical protein
LPHPASFASFVVNFSRYPNAGVNSGINLPNSMDLSKLFFTLDDGEWRSTFNWGGVAAFTARHVDIETGATVWLLSANRNMAI